MRGRPLGKKDSTPRKAYPVRGSKDGAGYTLADSGCKEATEYLGEQSSCLLCPYPVCQLDTPKKSGPKAKLTAQATQEFRGRLVDLLSHPLDK